MFSGQLRMCHEWLRSLGMCFTCFFFEAWLSLWLMRTRYFLAIGRDNIIYGFGESVLSIESIQKLINHNITFSTSPNPKLIQSLIKIEFPSINSSIPLWNIQMPLFIAVRAQNKTKIHHKNRIHKPILIQH